MKEPGGLCSSTEQDSSRASELHKNDIWPEGTRPFVRSARCMMSPDLLCAHTDHYPPSSAEETARMAPNFVKMLDFHSKLARFRAFLPKNQPLRLSVRLR